MTRPAAANREFAELMSDLAEGRILPAQVARLNELLCEDPANAEQYVDYMLIVTGLRWMTGDGSPEVQGDVSLQETQQATCGRRSEADAKRLSKLAVQPPVCGLPPSPLVLSDNTGHGTVGYFTSGWPVAYLVATAICGIGLLVGATFHVSSPESIVGQSPSIERGKTAAAIKKESVGRITAMIDCVWEGSGEERIQSRVRLGDKFSLASGLLEISYNTGGRVILQGPVRYEVESVAGGFLSVGKLTARLEKRSEVRGQRSEVRGQKSEVRGQKSEVRGQRSEVRDQTFAVRTPTAIVTDLGTEFGVEVSREGQTKSHVFRGSVKVELLGAGVQASGRTMVLHENESIETQRDADATKTAVRLIRVKVDPRAFVRRMEIPVKQLDLRDIVAGGDGRSQRGRRGVNPLDNLEETMLVPKAGVGQKPGRIGSADKLIDCIFLPDGNQGPVPLDSAGHTFNGFPRVNGMSTGSICATAADVATKGKTAAGQGGLLGFHSNAGIAFDLQAMRQRYAGVRPVRFRATAFCGSSAGVATLFEDDFQSVEAGTMPRDANRMFVPTVGSGRFGGRWMCSPGTDATIQVWNNLDPGKPANDAGTNRYLRIAWGNNYVNATGWPADTTLNGQVEVKFSIWKDSKGPAWSGVGGFVDELENERSFTVYFHSDGKVSYYDGAEMVDAGIRYRTDAWQDVTIRADMADQTYSLTVGGATTERLPWKFGTHRVNLIYFGYGGAPPGQFFLDNVKVAATAGLAESRRRGFGKEGQGDLRIFIDGRLKFERKGIRVQDGTIPLDILLDANDRYLTLVGTGEGEARPQHWMILGDPTLEMTLSEDAEAR